MNDMHNSKRKHCPHKVYGIWHKYAEDSNGNGKTAHHL